MSERPDDAMLNVRAIRVAMALKGWNQNKLAEEAGVSRITVGTTLDTWRASLDTAIKISRVLGLTPNQILVGWEQDSSDEPENDTGKPEYLMKAPMSDGAEPVTA